MNNHGKRGGKVFGSGSRNGVAILLMTKRLRETGDPAPEIAYWDVGDYLTREAKLNVVAEKELAKLEWSNISPNEYGDWVNKRSPAYMALRPSAIIQSERDGSAQSPPVFDSSSLGAVSSRDSWAFQSSRAALDDQMEAQATYYNEQVEHLKGEAATVLRDPRRFKWDGTAEQRARRGMRVAVSQATIVQFYIGPFSDSTSI